MFFRITHVNINGLRNKTHEITSMLDYRQSDVLLVSESRLSASIPDSRISVDVYNLIRKDRKHKSGGGLVAFVKSNVDFTIQEISLQCCESIAFSFPISKRKKALVILIYRPPGSNADTFVCSLERLLAQLNTNKEPLIMAGDIGWNRSSVS